MQRIIGVSSDRADLGIVLPVWKALVAYGRCELHVFLTGAHADNAERVLSLLPPGVKGHVGGRNLAGSRGIAAHQVMMGIASDAASLIAELQPDLLLVAGDRLDMFPVVTASIPFNIPIAHIAGGDLSFGAIDERLRHATTKLSHVHFVLNEGSAGRVHQMGEESWRIHVVGAPNLDSLLQVEAHTADEVAQEFGFRETKNLRLVTVHPETNSSNFSAPMNAVLAALDLDPALTILTAPNSDPGADSMRVGIEAFAASRPWAVFRENLGARWYANVMRHAAVMVGNSSSGIIEAGLFGLPVVNVGSRQAGRETGSNVVHCGNSATEVLACLRNLPDRSATVENSLYGDGRSGARIAEAISKLPDRERLLYKTFDSQAGAFRNPWSKH